jgi:ubiquinone/menaquinone biosynthesis C-methylase UbiE
VQAGAETLPFPDASFDTVTGGYVHCTIPRPELAIAEIARVLKPGGRYLFIEHVRA